MKNLLFLLLASVLLWTLNFEPQSAYAERRVAVVATRGEDDDPATADIATTVISSWPGVAVIERQALSLLFGEQTIERSLGEHGNTSRFEALDSILELHTFGKETFVILSNAMTGSISFISKCSKEISACLQPARSFLNNPPPKRAPRPSVALSSDDVTLRNEVFRNSVVLYEAGIPLVTRSAINSIHLERALITGGFTHGSPDSIIGADFLVAIERTLDGRRARLLESASGKELYSETVSTVNVSPRFIAVLSGALEKNRYEASPASKPLDEPRSVRPEAMSLWLSGVDAYLRGDYYRAAAHFFRSLDASPGFSLSVVWLQQALEKADLALFAEDSKKCISTAPLPNPNPGTLVLDDTLNAIAASNLDQVDDLPFPIHFVQSQARIAQELDFMVGAGNVEGRTWKVQPSMLFRNISLLTKNSDGTITLRSTDILSPSIIRKSSLRLVSQQAILSPTGTETLATLSLQAKDPIERDAYFIQSLAKNPEAYRFTQSFLGSFGSLSLQSCVRRSALRESARRFPTTEISAWIHLLLALSKDEILPHDLGHLQLAADSLSHWIPRHIAAAIVKGEKSIVIPADVVRASSVIPAELIETFSAPIDVSTLKIQLSEPWKNRGGKLLVTVQQYTIPRSMAQTSSPTTPVATDRCPFLDPKWITELTLSTHDSMRQFEVAKPFFAACSAQGGVQTVPYLEGLFILARGFQLRGEVSTAATLYERIASSRAATGVSIDDELQANALYQLGTIERANRDTALALRYAKDALVLCGNKGFHLFSAIRFWDDSRSLRDHSLELLSQLRGGSSSTNAH